MLTILKYGGLVVAAIASVYGTVTVTTYLDKDGVRRFTPQGYGLIAITIISLLLTVVSTAIDDRMKQSAEADRLVAEVARTNQIIIDGQPLVGLRIHWVFSGEDASLLHFMEQGSASIYNYAADVQGRDVEPDEMSAINRKFMLDPLLASVALNPGNLSAKPSYFASRTDGLAYPPDAFDTGGEATRLWNVLALISLDEAHQFILPIGSLAAGNLSWVTADQYPERALPDRPLSAGVDVCYSLPDTPCSQGRYKTRQTDSSPWVSLSSDGSIELDWTLDPLTVAGTLDEAMPATATARLGSPYLQVLIMSGLTELPFSASNFSRPTIALWSDPTSAQGLRPWKSTLDIQVNQLPEGMHHYVLSSVRPIDVTDNDGDSLRLAAVVLTYAEGPTPGSFPTPGPNEITAPPATPH